MKNLTDRQKEVLDFISQFTEDNAYPPTVREIGEHFGISLRAVQDHVAALQKKEYLSITQKRSRSMRVLKDERVKEPVINFIKFPLLKDTINTKGIFCQENFDKIITLTDNILKQGYTYFAFNVKDDSMASSGITKDMIAVIQQSVKPKEGQIVAVILDNALVLRRYSKDAQRICLMADSSTAPAYFQDISIEGVLSFVYKAY